MPSTVADAAKGDPVSRRIVVGVDASLNVIGSSGFVAIRGVVGSVSHTILHEADRPVVVTPACAVSDPDS